MKVTFKDLQQNTFVLDLDPLMTVYEAKEKIFQEKAYEVEKIKLIYSGKILADTNTIESYNVKEKSFIVCMVSKPIKRPVKAEVQALPAEADKARSENLKTEFSAENDSAASAAFNDPSALAVGAVKEEAVLHMMEMGYSRPECEKALKAAFNNPDRAAEYLLSGIPAHLEEPAHPTQPAQPLSSNNTTETQATDQSINLFEQAARMGSNNNETMASNTDLNSLRNSSQFRQLREVLQQQPHLLEPLIQQIGEANPSLMQLIAQNPSALMNLLSEGSDESLLPQQIQVTEEEQGAITRLESLGFQKETVIQAYFACEKDEELAANYLLEHGHDDDEDDVAQ